MERVIIVIVLVARFDFGEKRARLRKPNFPAFVFLLFRSRDHFRECCFMTNERYLVELIREISFLTNQMSLLKMSLLKLNVNEKIRGKNLNLIIYFLILG